MWSELFKQILDFLEELEEVTSKLEEDSCECLRIDYCWSGIQIHLCRPFTFPLICQKRWERASRKRKEHVEGSCLNHHIVGKDQDI